MAAEKVLPLDGWHPLEWWAEKYSKSKKTIRRWTEMGLPYSQTRGLIEIHEAHMAAFKAANVRGGNLNRAA